MTFAAAAVGYRNKHDSCRENMMFMVKAVEIIKKLVEQQIKE